MPATQPYIYESNDTKYYRLMVEDDLEDAGILRNRKKSVYFTDQEVEFGIIIKNLTNDKTLHVQTRVGVFFQHDLSVFSQTLVDVILEPGDSKTEMFEVGLLPFQETGIVGVSEAMPSNPNETGEDELTIESLSGTRGLKDTLHTFAVYDRDYYKVNSLYPRWAQYIAALLAVGIIFVGVFQIFF